MELINNFVTRATEFVPLLATIVVVVAGLVFIDRVLKRRWKDNPDAQFRVQLIMLALTIAGLLAVVLALPVSVETRGHLLSLIGILLSAAIALSSTTFIGNIMAGIMLKAVRSARPGDFITVADLTGRITEMGLLHTEIQTELRDLVTVPNLYMVTRPMQVVRSSGTIITAEVSLGYDVSHSEVYEVLGDAAALAGLRDGFVHVRDLGDFAVTYRVAGLLEDVKSLISARSRLRESVLNSLHAASIEIVSPNFMNTRALSDDRRFIPEPRRRVTQEDVARAEDLAFDKAEKAASVEEIRSSIEVVDAEIAALKEQKTDVAIATAERLETKRAHLVQQLEYAERQRKD